jgi:hypothetical protein
VTDPTRISGKHQQTVKSYCKSFFDKAASKYETREKRKTEKSTDVTPVADADTQMSDEAGATPPPLEDDDAASLKRKREGALNVDGADDIESSPSKRQKSTPPPPPPPPPPADTPNDDGNGDGDGDTSMVNADASPKDSDVNMETPGQTSVSIEG